MVLNNVTVSPLTFLRSKATLLIFHGKHSEPFFALPQLPLMPSGRCLPMGMGADCAMGSCGGHKLLSPFQEQWGHFRPSGVHGNPRSHCRQEKWDLHLNFLLSVHGLGFAAICLLWLYRVRDEDETCFAAWKLNSPWLCFAAEFSMFPAVRQTQNAAGLGHWHRGALTSLCVHSCLCLVVPVSFGEGLCQNMLLRY